MMIDCDRNMIVHLLRNWRPHRLRPQGFRLAQMRPRLMAMGDGKCAICNDPLVNDGRVTHIDHIETVKALADKVIGGDLTFDEAYNRLWDDSNLRAAHRKCNYGRNAKPISS